MTPAPIDIFALVVTGWFLFVFMCSNVLNVALIYRTWPLLARLVALVVFLVVVALAYIVLIGLDIPSALRSITEYGPARATPGSVSRTALMALWFTGQSYAVWYVTGVLVRMSPPRERP